MYHVYNRVARGGHRFWEEGAGGRLLAGIPERKKPDEFVVMVDRVMSNHWHLPVGMGHVPLEGRYGFLVKSRKSIEPLLWPLTKHHVAMQDERRRELHQSLDLAPLSVGGLITPTDVVVEPGPLVFRSAVTGRRALRARGA